MRRFWSQHSYNNDVQGFKGKVGHLPEQMGNFGQETVTKKKPNGSSRIEQYNG